MKAVIDTNTFVTGIFWGGYPGKVLQLWRDKRFMLVVNDSILSEYIRVIDEIASGKDPALAKEWLRYILENAIVIKHPDGLKLCRDPHDDMFINCAVYSKSRFIVSGDKDLLILKEVEGIPIVKSKDFLRYFEK
jgi:putative PIN family toxin of toxin-antitoxin system